MSDLVVTYREDDEFDTVGGFLMHQLGRIPKQGEFVCWNDLRITVLEASRRRAKLVRIVNESRSPSRMLMGD